VIARVAGGAERAREGIAAAALAGIQAARCVPLGFRDLEAASDLPGLCRAVLAMLLRVRPRTVLAHAQKATTRTTTRSPSQSTAARRYPGTEAPGTIRFLATARQEAGQA